MELTNSEKRALTKILLSLDCNVETVKDILKLDDHEIARYQESTLLEAADDFSILMDYKVFGFALKLLNSYDFNQDKKLNHPSNFSKYRQRFEDVNIRRVYAQIENVLESYPNPEQIEADNIANEINIIVNDLISIFGENGNQFSDQAQIRIKHLDQGIKKFRKFCAPFAYDSEGNMKEREVYTVFWNGKSVEIFDLVMYLNRYIGSLNENFGTLLRPIKNVF